MDLDNILKNVWTSPLRQGYANVQGYTLTQRYLELKNDIDNLKVDENDVWLCTFPKTGSTWTQEMTWMITNNLDFENGQQLLEERSPFIDFSLYYEKDHFSKFNSPPFMRDSITFYNNAKRPRIVKTHLPYELLPNEITTGFKNPKIIYVIRNPKDTCVSYYHHARLLEGFKGNFQNFCELFLGGKVLFGPYSKHILSYWKRRNSLNILILKYEDMKKDLEKTIIDVSTFLERPLTQNQVEILSKHLCFDSMKRNKSVNKDGIADLNHQFKQSTNPRGKFMRSGTVGDYKNHMTEEMSTRFDEWVEEEFQSIDFQF